MRSRISAKAWAACRTSRAPRGRKSSGSGRPLPKASAASARRRIGLIWFLEEQNGDRQQHERGCDHPDEEYVRVRSVGLAPRRRETENGIVDLDAHVDESRVADGVDPERIVHLLANLARERPVEQIEEGFGSRRWQLGGREHLQGQAHAPVCHLDQGAVVVVLLIRLECIYDGGDVAGRRLRQAPRHGFPVPLHENEGNDGLEQNDRRDDDDERSGIQTLRHELGAERGHPLQERARRPKEGRCIVGEGDHQSVCRM